MKREVEASQIIQSLIQILQNKDIIIPNEVKEPHKFGLDDRGVIFKLLRLIEDNNLDYQINGGQALLRSGIARAHIYLNWYKS